MVMPVYKVEKYVSECLDSIINQTFDCFECIIIDDCSPDNSMRLIEEKLAGYKGNISFRIVRNERNEGVSAARNKGIELSRGGYLFFIDSDDMLYENCLEKLWEETKRYPGIDLVQGDSYSEGMENKNSDLQIYGRTDTYQQAVSGFENNIHSGQQIDQKGGADRECHLFQDGHFV